MCSMTKFIAVNKDIQQYCEQNSTQDSQLLKNLVHETECTMHIPQMLSNPLVGNLLRMLVQITDAKNILEIGMYTGYTALQLASGISNDGKVITCEADERVLKISKKYFKQSPDGHKIELLFGKALDTIPKLTQSFDFIFIDAKKNEYPAYFELVLPKLKSGGVIIFDNMLLEGTVLQPKTSKQQIIADFNYSLSQDSRIEVILLPIQDGVTIIKKK